MKLKKRKRKIKSFLREGQFDEARGMAMKILEKPQIKTKKDATARVEQGFQEA